MDPILRPVVESPAFEKIARGGDPIYYRPLFGKAIKFTIQLDESDG